MAAAGNIKGNIEDGELIVLNNLGRVYKVSATGTSTLWADLSAYSPQGGIAVGLSGEVYFGYFNGSTAAYIGKISPSGVINASWLVFPGTNGPSGISTDIYGYLYFALNQTFYKVDTSTALYTSYFLISLSGITNVVVDTNRNMYFASANGNINKITLAGVVTQSWGPVTGGASNYGLLLDTNNNVYVYGIGNGAYKFDPTGAAVSWGLIPGAGPWVMGPSNTIYGTGGGIYKVDSSGNYTPSWATTAGFGSGIAYNVLSDSLYAIVPSTNTTISKVTIAGVATNNWGTVPASGSAIISYNAPTVPGAPVIGTADVASATSVSVSFTQGTGGTPTSYTVTSSPGGFTASGFNSPITITGLTTGTPYTFTVTATNSVGTSPASSASNSATPSLAGFIYITNQNSNSVSLVTPSGVIDTTYNVGTGPRGIAIDSSGNVYVANTGDSTISKITSAGTVTASWATGFAAPVDVATDSSGNVYSVSSSSRNITKITAGGVVTNSWAQMPSGSVGNAIAIDSSDNVYTVNEDTTFNIGTVTKVTSAGVATQTWVTLPSTARCLTIDSLGNIYTGNTNNTISKITPAAVITNSWVSGVTGYGLACDSSDTIYGVSGGSFIFKVTSAGVVTSSWAALNVSASPRQIAVNKTGIVYTPNYLISTASKVTSAGVVTDPFVSGLGTNPFGIAVVIPATAPDAPTIGTASAASSTSASVAFTPGSNGGSPILGYTVTSSPGGITATGSSSPITVTGLTTGTPYTFTVTATNAIGTSSASAASNSVTPSGTNFGPIYSIINFSGGTVERTTLAAVSTPNWATSVGTNNWDCTVDTSGNIFALRSDGINAKITKITSGGVVNNNFSTYGGPTNGTRSGTFVSDNQDNLYFLDPASYTNIAKITPAGVASTFATLSSAAFGLTIDSSGNLYATLQGAGTVAKITSGGTVDNSWATVGTSPSGITCDSSNNIYVCHTSSNGVSKIAPNATVTNNYGTSSFNNGYFITAYSDGTVWVADQPSLRVYKVTSSSVTSYTAFTGTPYDITVDGAGNCYVLQLDQIIKITPAGTFFSSWATLSVNAAKCFTITSIASAPNAPTIGSASAASSTSAVVNFTSGGANGSPILGYTVTSSPGGITATGSSSPINVTGLSGGTTYTFTVTATNAIGTSSPSAASNSITTTNVGEIYISNSGSNTITKISSGGSITTNWASAGSSSVYGIVVQGSVYILANGNSITRISADGTVTSNWATGIAPTGVLVAGPNGDLYGTKSNGIFKVTANGVVSSSWASLAFNPNAAVKFGVDSSGNVYVPNTTDSNGTVVQISSTGVVNTSWYSNFNSIPAAVLVDSSDNIYVVSGNGGNTTIRKLDPSGTALGFWSSGIDQPTTACINSAGDIVILGATSQNVFKWVAGTFTNLATISYTGYNVNIAATDTYAHTFDSSAPANNTIRITLASAASPTNLATGSNAGSIGFTATNS
jgi:hypothetical protein